MNPTAHKVFISYSHDSPEHRERVLGLSETLRAHGIETLLDRYVNGSPPEGWPRWMLGCLQQASHVICVCTETYYRRFLGQELPGKGKGVAWEGALITTALYDARSISNKFVPVIFDRADEAHVPDPMRAQTHYVLDSKAGFQALYDALLGKSGVEPGPVGELRQKPRPTCTPLMFNPEPAIPRPAATFSAALSVWREKLEFLLIEEAVAVDPNIKFNLKHSIREAQDRIRGLEKED